MMVSHIYSHIFVGGEPFFSSYFNEWATSPYLLLSTGLLSMNRNRSQRKYREFNSCGIVPHFLTVLCKEYDLLDF